MPRRPNRPLSYGSTASTSAKIAAAPSASAPRKAASQRPHASASVSARSASELEIDELIGVLITQFDEQRNRDKAERRRDHDPRPRVEPGHDVLGRRQQKCDQRREENRPRASDGTPIGRDGEPLIDAPCGLERAR